MIAGIVIAVIVIFLLIILIKNVVIVRQSRAYVIERLGAFHAVWGVGIHFKIPFIERVAKVVSLKEQVVDFAPQPVITKDNVTMQIDTVVFFEITDPKLYTYGVEHPMPAIENLTATTLRNIIGELELDQSLTSRDVINTKMRAILDEATDPWGIRVNRVELKNIIPPREIQDAMERQMKAERERRETLLQAEGQKQSKILVAEGERQSVILRAQAAKEAKIMEAEAQAAAILKVKEAEAEGLRLLTAAAPSHEVIQLKSLEAFAAAADGKATKIIIPSEIQGLAGLAEGVIQAVSPVVPPRRPPRPRPSQAPRPSPEPDGGWLGRPGMRHEITAAPRCFGSAGRFFARRREMRQGGRDMGMASGRSAAFRLPTCPGTEREKEAFTRRTEGAFAMAEGQGSRWDERGDAGFLI